MPLWRFIRGHKIAHLQLQLIYQSQHLKITGKKLVNFTIREMSIRIWINTPTTTYPPQIQNMNIQKMKKVAVFFVEFWCTFSSRYDTTLYFFLFFLPVSITIFNLFR